MATPDLTLVMVVKNEAKGLEQCIASARPFVGKVIIAVDRASTDKTAQIAESLADEVKYFDWSDNFAEARNFAHQGVTTKWILFLDGHEYIKKCEKLDEYLQSTEDGLAVTVEMENGMAFRNPRIYKNGIQFVGAVHEQQLCNTIKYYPDFIVQHDRIGRQNPEAAAARDIQRDKMVPTIMAERWAKNNRDIRASFHMGLHAQSKQQWSAAVKWYNRYLKFATDKGQVWFVYFNISLCRLTQRKLFRAFWAVVSAELVNPGRWETEKLKGIIYFERRKYTQALDCLVNSMNVNTGDVTYKPWKRDNAGTFNIIGECFFRLGNYGNASLSFTAAADRCEEKTLVKFFQDRARLMLDLSKAG